MISAAGMLGFSELSCASAELESACRAGGEIAAAAWMADGGVGATAPAWLPSGLDGLADASSEP